MFHHDVSNRRRRSSTPGHTVQPSNITGNKTQESLVNSITYRQCGATEWCCGVLLAAPQPSRLGKKCSGPTRFVFAFGVCVHSPATTGTPFSSITIAALQSSQLTLENEALNIFAWFNGMRAIKCKGSKVYNI